MSHNTIQINTQTPDGAGEITLPLDALSDVSAPTPNANELLVYGGATWGASADLITPASARGTAGSSSTSSSVLITTPNPYLGGADPNRMYWEYAALQQGSALRMGESSSSDVSFRVNAYGITRWTVGFDFSTAGVYALRATLHIGALSASTAYIDCSWTDINYNKLGPIARFSTSTNKRNTLHGIIDATAGDVAGVYIDSVSNAYYNQASYTNIFIEVERIS